MTLPKKSSKLSLKFIAKKTRRRNRNRIRKLARLLIPTSLILSVISIGLIIFLLQIIHQPALISPLAITFYNTAYQEDKYQAELEKILEDKKISFSAISKLPDSFKIKITNSGEVIISSQKDLNTQIHSLQYILSRLTMEGKHFSRLDLRFEKPVIVLR